MAAPSRRTGADTASPATFSYAQAARGLSSAPASAPSSSKPSSGTATPAKDANPTAPISQVPSVPNWADDAEAHDQFTEKPSSTRESQSQGPPVSKQPNAAQPVAASIISSPDLGASSSSTVTKDDDVSSLPNASSESTWENKSQASTSVEKSTEPVEKTSDKVKGKDLERSPFKPLQDAPIPVVNIWKQRAEEAKAKQAQKPNAGMLAVASSATPNGVPQGPSGATFKKANGAQDKAEGRVKPREDDKPSQPRRDGRADLDSEKARKGTKGRSIERDQKPIPSVLPLPPDRDQESWPTPETVVDEDRKKAQEKGEKERKESASTVSHGKQEWVKVPITPTVIFNTPLPNTASSRRGGRGGARGGGQNGSRAGGFNADKDGSASAANNDPKRGRLDGSVVCDASPAKGKRTVSSGSPSSKEKMPMTNGEKSSKAAGLDADAQFRRASVAAETVAGSQISGQGNTYPRQYPQNRPSKGRKAEMPGQGERRKDSDTASPTKENGTSYERRTSAAPQAEAGEGPVFADGPNSKLGTSDRRPYGTFSSRDRRGGPRGSRGGFQNGHQFSNSNVPPLQSSSTFPLPRSPTTFNPEQSAYFPPPHGRGYRGNGGRSQSVASDNVYRYQGGPQQIPPIQTYMGGVYEYPPVQPMSAMPYSPFGMEPFTLFSMVTTQLEYYFSVDNLCKDLFLRKHMDSKGFVFLNVIAGFNRVKSLTTDMELIKLVCYQSRQIDFCLGSDGKERVRPRDNWEQWVLNVSERDPSAQNDGPEELHNPPIPNPQGFDQTGLPRYPEMPPGSPPGPIPFGHDAPYVNGFHPAGAPSAPIGDMTNGSVPEGPNGSAFPNGHPSGPSTKAVSGEPDSFSDDQVESLTVVVRKQDPSQTPAISPSAIRTFSNGSIDSKNGVPDDSEIIAGRQANLKVNGTSPSQGVDSQVQDQPRRTLSPFATASTMTPVRLYWVKDKDTPVDSIPPDSTHESYYHLRSKALQQRQNAALGACPYDMDVLYQFWSHFLIRNFNRRMYDEFRYFAFEDAARRMSDIGLENLIKFYGESLLSPKSVVRERVARHYVDLVKSENEYRRPAFKTLRSVWRNGALDPRNRIRLGDFLDEELKSSLE